MKWVFYVVVFIYMFYRAVYGARIKTISSLQVDPVNYGEYENYLPPGSVKTIPCIYSNKFQQVEWVNPAGETVSSVKSNRIFTQKHQAQTPHGGRNSALLLTFTDAWVEDSGEYTCQSDGMAEAVSVCVIDPLTFVDTPSEVSVDVGRSFTLTCEARGEPEPRLVWYRDEEIISDDCNSTKYKVMTKFNSQGFQGQLTIASIDPDDAGSYTCEAIQEHKELEGCRISKSWNMTLNVNYAPTFGDDDLSVLFAKVNKSVDFECAPKAYPTPEFRWFSEVDDGTLVNYPEEKVMSLEDEASTKITILANALTFGMKYVCRATNTFGYASKAFLVLETKKPKQPYEVNINNLTDNQIELNVTWEDEVLFPIDEFHIQYLEREGKQKTPKEYEWKRAKEQVYDLAEDSHISGADVKVIVSDLEAETNYWIRVRAVNELGFSAWSHAIQATTEPKEYTFHSTTDSSSAGELAESQPDTVDEKRMDEARTDSMFYGIFFAGGILVVSFLCMLIMRLV